MVNGLPERLREMREKLNYSQNDVAELMGLSPSAISSYESGDRTPSLESLIKLTKIYHCSCDYLLGISTGKPDTILSLDGLSDSTARALQYLINAMQSDQQK